ncbi:MAG: CSLREA domain-containing protein [Tetrasphaera sp.]
MFKTVRAGLLATATAAVSVGVGPALAPAATAAPVATFVVNSTADAPDSANDGLCKTSTNVCTLRAALTEAGRASGHAEIDFNIPGGGVKTIAPATKLPGLTNPAGTTIDGYTQPGASPNTAAKISNASIMIEIKGKGPNGFDGLSITTPNNTIRGLSIYLFAKHLALSGNAADNNDIVGNYICTNAAGTYKYPSTHTKSLGMVLDRGPSGNHIGTPALADRNVFSGCGHRAVTLSFAPTSGNYIQNNIMGLNPAGTAALSNGSQGVDINYTSGNFVGGLGANEGNVLSANRGAGVEVSHGSNTHDNVVNGNLIGTDPFGNVTGYSGNVKFGIRFEGPKFCGDPARPNPGGCTNAAVAEGLPHDNSATGNVVVSNGRGGILIDKGHNHVTIQDNWVGVTPSGAAGRNGTAGIDVQRGPYGLLIKQNHVANNPVGIRITSKGYNPSGPEQETHENTISRNSTWAGTGIQFTWGTSAALVQDNIQPPTITAQAGGMVSGTACSNCTIEVFVAATKTGKMGKTYLSTVTANAAGNWSANTGQPGGTPITATATDAAGNTSVFAVPVLAKP